MGGADSLLCGLTAGAIHPLVRRREHHGDTTHNHVGHRLQDGGARTALDIRQGESPPDIDAEPPGGAKYVERAVHAVGA